MRGHSHFTSAPFALPCLALLIISAPLFHPPPTHNYTNVCMRERDVSATALLRALDYTHSSTRSLSFFLSFFLGKLNTIYYG